MGVNSVIKLLKESGSLAEIYRAQNGGGEILLYSMLFGPHGLLETLWEDKSTRKDNPNLEGLEIQKKRQLGVEELLRYLIDCYAENKSSSSTELPQRL